MFRCLWLRAPRDLPLSTRLYQRTYGRTYGRRPSEADQPVTMPQALRLSAAPATLEPTGGDAVAANALHQAA